LTVKATMASSFCAISRYAGVVVAIVDRMEP
jgi:hypothetical protein